ncbi:polysaccharide export protein [Ilyomonas limi]|uniref:Polysaccharide export protein n=1 Tax=Ilyomonas limi TaxID=2575867 RepID=A0A4V5UWV3_9BACT|nr:polysaccharide biosynthesis/export family protein [Ilyomonas limi]TKK70323.1 polysaccharide export protein [Ilyomonas limi]
MEKRGLFFSGIVLPCVFVFLFTSCVNTKKAVYFNNIADTVLPALVDGLEPVIQKGDLLSISVSSLSPEVTTIFNAANTPASSSDLSSSTLSQAVGYLISQDGNIDFPMLGTLSVAGLSKEALKDLITHKLEEKKLLFNPVVTIRYLNFHVTVLGEVSKPGVITIPNEQVTLLEAIGMAGDLTIYGKRDNVLLLRKENGQKIVQRLNLNSESLLSSPYYYLKSNDVVYVEPNKNKVTSVSQSRQLLPIILSGLSFLTIIADRIIVN